MLQMLTLHLGTSGTGKYLFSSDTGIVLPTGTTADKTNSLKQGVMRFNTELANMKYHKMALLGQI